MPEGVQQDGRVEEALVVLRLEQVKQRPLGCFLPELKLLADNKGLHDLPLDQRADDPGQHFNGAVQLDCKPAIVAQCFIVLWCWGHVHNDQCNTVDCYCKRNVITDAIHC